MTESTQIQPKPTDVFVAPLDDLHPADIDANLKALDRWLVDVSGGVLTLDRVETIARNAPVLANIFAAVDLIADIRAMIDHGDRPIDLFDWVNLGLDLIGVIPIPMGTAQIRMGRGPCSLLREEIAKNGKAMGEAAMQMVRDGIITAIVASLQARYAGEIETFLTALRAELAAVLSAAADYVGKVMNGLADLFAHAAGEPLDYGKDLDQAGQHLSAATRNILYEPGEAFDNIGALFYDAVRVVGKETINTATSVAKYIDSDASAKLMSVANSLRRKVPAVQQAVRGARWQRGGQDRLADPRVRGRRDALAQDASQAAGGGHPVEGRLEGRGAARAGADRDARRHGAGEAPRAELLQLDRAGAHAGHQFARLDRLCPGRRADRP
nr:hypothetical protein [Burkholderia glumae]